MGPEHLCGRAEAPTSVPGLSGKKLREHVRGIARYPAQSCETCRDIKEIDGEDPLCETGEGCPILLDRFGDAERRALRMRGMLTALKDLTGPDAVLRAFGADMEDLELLAAIEDELQEHRRTNGEG